MHLYSSNHHPVSGVGYKTCEKLANLGITTVRQLRGQSRELLQRQLGPKHGQVGVAWGLCSSDGQGKDQLEQPAAVQADIPAAVLQGHPAFAVQYDSMNAWY